ncbi:MAG TPA: twin-arginine translocase TatA/TatE family subunit [Tepidisphaeraceae bacterium]|jgi:sec-independent protein translocase protein TatA
MFPLAIGMPGPFEMILLAGLGLLFFGKRLPDVGRSIGQTVVQFKKGLTEVSEEMKKSPDADKALPDNSGFKFDPHTGKTIEP